MSTTAGVTFVRSNKRRIAHKSPRSAPSKPKEEEEEPASATEDEAPSSPRLRVRANVLPKSPRSRGPSSPRPHPMSHEQPRSWASASLDCVSVAIRDTAKRRRSGKRRRTSNEDAFRLATVGGLHYVGIFDGHGGASVSTYLRDHLHGELQREIANTNITEANQQHQQQIKSEADLSSSSHASSSTSTTTTTTTTKASALCLEHNLHTAFMRSDEKMYKETTLTVVGKKRPANCSCNFYRENPCVCSRVERTANQGSTGTVVMVSAESIVCANVGDSEAMVICLDDVDAQRLSLTGPLPTSDASAVGVGVGGVDTIIVAPTPSTCTNGKGSKRLLYEDDEPPLSTAEAAVAAVALSSAPLPAYSNNKSSTVVSTSVALAVASEAMGARHKKRAVMTVEATTSVVVEDYNPDHNTHTARTPPVRACLAHPDSQSMSPGNINIAGGVSNNATSSSSTTSSYEELGRLMDSPRSHASSYSPSKSIDTAVSDDQVCDDSPDSKDPHQLQQEQEPCLVDQSISSNNNNNSNSDNNKTVVSVIDGAAYDEVSARVSHSLLTFAHVPVVDEKSEDYLRIRKIARSRAKDGLLSADSDGIQRGRTTSSNYVHLDGAHKLNMTRAFGNFGLKQFASQGGKIVEARSSIIPRPNTLTIPRSREQLCVVVASDGLWDNLTPEDMRAVVMHGVYEYAQNKEWQKSAGNGNPRTCATVRRAFLEGAGKHALKRAMAHAKKANKKQDDITIVVVLFPSIVDLVLVFNSELL